MVLPEDIDGNEPTHGSVKSRFSVLPPIANEVNAEASTDSAGSGSYAATDTSVSLSDYVHISRSNSRACDCTSPCVHQVLANAHHEVLSESETWIGNYKDNHALHTVEATKDDGKGEHGVEDSNAGSGESSGLNPTLTETGEKNVSGDSAPATTEDSSAQKSDTNAPATNIACDDPNDLNTNADGETVNSLNSLGTPTREEGEVKEEVVSVTVNSPDNKSNIAEQAPQAAMPTTMVGIVSTTDRDEASKDKACDNTSPTGHDVTTESKTRADRSTLPPIEGGRSNSSPSNTKPKESESQAAVHVKQQQTGKDTSRDTQLSSGSDMPRSSVDSSGSYSHLSRSSSSGGSGYVPTPNQARPKRRLPRNTFPPPQTTNQLPVVSLRGSGSGQGQFPQVQSPNLRPGSELSNVPYRHRLSAISRGDSSGTGSAKSNNSVTSSKVIVTDDPSVRDNIDQQHLKALQNQIDFTSANTPLIGVALGVPEDVRARPVTVNGVVSQDRGSEFKGEDDTLYYRRRVSGERFTESG